MSRTPPSRTSVASDVVAAAVELRHRLHEIPETANQEAETAASIVAFLREQGLEPAATGIAGHGLMYRIEGEREGPARLFRADLDGLPLDEASGVKHASKREGHHHACGHDGHMAMLIGALVRLHNDRSSFAGTIDFLFQPAEETGQGAADVLADRAVKDKQWDQVFAIHNLPGRALGEVYVRRGTMACASTGLHIRFEGETSHAGAPREGRNPIPALSVLALRAEALPGTVVPFGASALVTPIHFDAGQIAYGTAAGHGSVRFTVRAERRNDLERIVERIRALAAALAEEGGFQMVAEEVEPFPATMNDAQATRCVETAAAEAGLPVAHADIPMAWSEDFGHFTDRFPGALLCLGAGEDAPDLHTRGYDFPDALVEKGIAFWVALAATEADP